MKKKMFLDNCCTPTMVNDALVILKAMVEENYIDEHPSALQSSEKKAKKKARELEETFVAMDHRLKNGLQLILNKMSIR